MFSTLLIGYKYLNRHLCHGDNLLNSFILFSLFYLASVAKDLNQVPLEGAKVPLMSHHIFPQVPTFHYHSIFLFAKRLMNKDLSGSCNIG